MGKFSSLFEKSRQEVIELSKSLSEERKAEKVAVYLFGSRSRDDFREESDIDLGVLADDEYFATFLRERIENSCIPYKVDVIDLKEVAEEFRREVMEKGILLWQV